MSARITSAVCNFIALQHIGVKLKKSEQFTLGQFLPQIFGQHMTNPGEYILYENDKRHHQTVLSKRKANVSVPSPLRRGCLKLVKMTSQLPCLLTNHNTISECHVTKIPKKWTWFLHINESQCYSGIVVAIIHKFSLSVLGTWIF